MLNTVFAVPHRDVTTNQLLLFFIPSSRITIGVSKEAFQPPDRHSKNFISIILTFFTGNLIF